MKVFKKRIAGIIVMLVFITTLIVLIFMLADEKYSEYIIESRKEYHNIVEMPECPGYLTRCGNYITQLDGWIPMMNICWMYEEKYDEELERKVKDTIYKYTLSWMPEEFIGVEYAGAYTMLETDTYVSLRNDYRLAGQPENEFIPVCITADIATGEILYLDDLIMIDEELAKRILKAGFVRSDTMRDNPRDKYALTREELAEYNTDLILERLAMCSRPYDAENYQDKPSFYLRHGRLYLCNVFSGEPDLYIELERIEDKLKREQVW